MEFFSFKAFYPAINFHKYIPHIVSKLNNLRKESVILQDKIAKLDKKKEREEETIKNKEEAISKIVEACEKLGLLFLFISI